MTEEREPIPAGTVSTVRGRYQRPALTWLTWTVIVAGLAGAALPGSGGTAVATAAVGAVVAAPLLRVAWLVLRWSQERDRRFELLGAAVLVVVTAGAVLSALGVGT